MQENPRILIAGCGKIGYPLAQMLAKSHSVWALSRRPRTAHAPLQFVQADLCLADSLKALPECIDTLVYCVSPTERTEQGYRDVYLEGLRNLWGALARQGSSPRLLYVSSTSVYGQHQHEWVDEQSPTEPRNFSGQILLQAEQLAGQLSPLPTVVRFSGIYGGTRSRLIDQVRNGQAQLKNTLHYTNRIHESDCIGFLAHLLQQAWHGQTLAPCYLASDDLPVSQNEVLSFLAEHLGVRLETGDAPLMREGVGSKRCRNTLLHRSGYTLRYPSYREGYAEMLGLQAPSS